uniref:Prolyl endopeptidase n=1 Tax=Parastrongyloides trichosuri TaxID=131310 RepID=A0A0N4ZM74_PARTI
MYSNFLFILILLLILFPNFSTERKYRRHYQLVEQGKSTHDCSKVKINVNRYPYVKPNYTIVDESFGQRIPDFYRDLENTTSKKSITFIKSLNLLSERTLSKSKFRKRIKKTLTRYLDHEKFDIYSKDGNYYYFYHNSGLQEQRVLKRVKNIGDTPETFLDVNTLSKEGTISLNEIKFSNDGSIMAYSLSVNGSDWMTIKFKHSNGEDLPDVINNVIFSEMQFVFGNKGFLYGTYDKHSNNSIKHVLYYHKMGTDQTDAKYDILDNDRDIIYVFTNKNTPLGEIIKMNLKEISKGGEKWQVIVKEKDNAKIDAILSVGSQYFIINRLKDVVSHLYVYDKMNGTLLRELKLPKGVVTKLTGRKDSNEFFVAFTNQATPGTVYRGNIDNLKLKRAFKFEKVVQNVPKGFKGDNLQVTQIFYKSTNSTKIPLFMLHRKNLKFNSKNPVLLEVHGGYGIVSKPYFSTSRYLFVKKFNGIWCIANIRGGGEYGDEWHKAGVKHNKQNSIDDVIHAAKYLIKHRYTRPSKLSIYGSSNGGFVVTAASQQRPDLFGAVISKAGVYDMLRYPKFSIGKAWIPEYGDPSVEKDFKHLFKISPLHNIRRPKKHRQWPSTLMLSDLHDDRVNIGHTLKYAASLYHFFKLELDHQKNPVIVEIDKGSGHGIEMGLSKLIEEISDEYAFLHLTLNLRWRNN